MHGENDAPNERPCAEHHCQFDELFVEHYMVPIILQQFLTDLSWNSFKDHEKSQRKDRLNDLQIIDFKEIETFWSRCVAIIPKDLDLIWNTIEIGLNRYLEVNK